MADKIMFDGNSYSIGFSIGPKPEIRKESVAAVEAAMDALTPDERLEVFGEYCMGCGDKDAFCQCRNDE